MPCSAISFAAFMKPPHAVARQRTADADAADAEIGGFCSDGPAAPTRRLTGLGCTAFTTAEISSLRRDAGRIEAVGAGLGIGGEPVDHELQILLPAQKRLAAAGEQDAAVVGIDRLARRLDAIDRERAIEQRLGGVAGKILDREAGNAGLDRARDVDADLVRLVRKAVLEIGVDGNIDRRADRGEMIADVIDGDAVVGLGDGPGKARAGRSQRLEAEMLQRLRAAGVVADWE